MITKNNYSEERHPCALLRDAIETIESNTETPEEVRKFRARKDRLLRKLAEEAIPIAHFGISFLGVRQRVLCACTYDDTNYDGIILISNPLTQDSSHIEVTCTDDYEEALRRELLNKTGHTPSVGSIHRNKITGEVEAAIEAVNHNELIEKEALQAIDRIDNKLEKDYPKNTILLVSTCIQSNYTVRDKYHFVDIIAKEMANRKSIFSSIFIYETKKNWLEMVKSS